MREAISEVVITVLLSEKKRKEMRIKMENTIR